jgi:riboflavin biosynthesis pyrimidine reductase
VLAGLKERRPPAQDWPEGVAVLGLAAGPRGRISFCELAQQLYELGVGSLLVEGGAAVAQEVLLQQAADKLTFVYTPRIIGREGLEFSPPLGCHSIEACPRLVDPQVEVLGPDAAISGYPDWPADICALEER